MDRCRQPKAVHRGVTGLLQRWRAACVAAPHLMGSAWPVEALLKRGGTCVCEEIKRACTASSRSSRGHPRHDNLRCPRAGQGLTGAEGTRAQVQGRHEDLRGAMLQYAREGEFVEETVDQAAQI